MVVVRRLKRALGPKMKVGLVKEDLAWQPKTCNFTSTLQEHV